MIDPKALKRGFLIRRKQHVWMIRCKACAAAWELKDSGKPLAVGMVLLLLNHEAGHVNERQTHRPLANAEVRR